MFCVARFDRSWFLAREIFFFSNQHTDGETLTDFKPLYMLFLQSVIAGLV